MLLIFIWAVQTDHRRWDARFPRTPQILSLTDLRPRRANAVIRSKGLTEAFIFGRVWVLILKWVIERFFLSFDTISSSLLNLFLLLPQSFDSLIFNRLLANDISRILIESHRRFVLSLILDFIVHHFLNVVITCRFSSISDVHRHLFMIYIYRELALDRITFVPRELLLVHESLLEVSFNAKIDLVILIRAVLHYGWVVLRSPTDLLGPSFKCNIDFILYLGLVKLVAVHLVDYLLVLLIGFSAADVLLSESLVFEEWARTSIVLIHTTLTFVYVGSFISWNLTLIVNHSYISILKINYKI